MPKTFVAKTNGIKFVRFALVSLLRSLIALTLSFHYFNEARSARIEFNAGKRGGKNRENPHSIVVCAVSTLIWQLKTV